MVSKKSKLIFLMPPKTASNSLKECLLDSYIKLDEFPEFDYPKIHLYLSELQGLFEIEDLSDYKVIQITRDPYSRFVSAYHHQLRLVPNTHPLKNLTLEEYATRVNDCLNEGSFLKNFYFNRTNFITKSIQNRVHWGGVRTHLNQVQFKDVESNIKYFKLEEIAKDITPLSDFIGVYLPELEQKNTNKSEKEEITKVTKSIIKNIYSKDFETLGYEY
jgi:hypothetical protein